MIEIKAMENQAEKDLEEKLALEKSFDREVRAIFAVMVKEFAVTFARSGSPVDANKYKATFEQAIKKHYARVQKKFKGTVLGMNDMIADEQLMSEIDFLLLEWSDNTAPQQAEYITETNNKNIQSSVQKAITSNLDEGLAYNNRTVAATAAALLRRSFKGRVGGISTYETQISSESTKEIEALSVARSVTAKDPKKRWITIGDKIVRVTHKEANGQRRPLRQAFNVGGAKLMYPGDTSLGAPIKEVANCRCSAGYDIGAIK